MADDDALRELTGIWRAHGLSPEDLREESDGTLVASDRKMSLTSGSAARVVIKPSRPPSGGVSGEREATHLGEELEMGPLLGKGGMGQVRSAKQPSLRREVAVKLAHRPGEQTEQLLKEAWVGGALEHPNTVPVHTIGIHEGQPAVVMKRIEGMSWTRLLQVHDPDSPSESVMGKAGARVNDTTLGFHVRILMRVCDAIGFAHSRGVLHLDLKPDNVMIGDHGEVYVLDWGLSMRHGDSPTWLTPAAEINGVAGTPAYMAPELAMGAGPKIGPHTDVYLLGGLLHELVTGQPLHVGDTPMARLLSAYRSTPREYDPGVPRELVAILHRATAREPADRFPDVASFRDALQAFLTHRDAEALYVRAERELAALREATEANVIDAALVQAKFGACRFLLREAHALWPEHPRLSEAKKVLYETIARAALASGEADLARSHLAEIDDPAPELLEEIEAALRSADARRARANQLEALAREEDIHTGLRFRVRLAVSLATVFAVCNAIMGWGMRSGAVVLDYPDLLATGVATLALVIVPVGWGFRHIWFQNRASTGLFTIIIVTFFAVQLFWTLGLSTGIPFIAALALTPVLYALSFGACAVLVDPRLWPAAVIQAPTLILAAAYYQYAFEIVGAGGALSVFYLALEWARQDRAHRAEAAR